jgi:hypothetical protein
MKNSKLNGIYEDEKHLHELFLNVFEFQENNYYFVYSPDLDLTGYDLTA